MQTDFQELIRHPASAKIGRVMEYFWPDRAIATNLFWIHGGLGAAHAIGVANMTGPTIAIMNGDAQDYQIVQLINDLNVSLIPTIRLHAGQQLLDMADEDAFIDLDRLDRLNLSSGNATWNGVAGTTISNETHLKRTADFDPRTNAFGRGETLEDLRNILNVNGGTTADLNCWAEFSLVLNAVQATLNAMRSYIFAGQQGGRAISPVTSGGFVLS